MVLCIVGRICRWSRFQLVERVEQKEVMASVMVTIGGLKVSGLERHGSSVRAEPPELSVTLAKLVVSAASLELAICTVDRHILQQQL